MLLRPPFHSGVCRGALGKQGHPTTVQSLIDRNKHLVDPEFVKTLAAALEVTIAAQLLARQAW
jgi:hypothetical protein